MPELAFAYIEKTGGLDTEESYPYEHGRAGKCRYNPNHKGARVTGFTHIRQGDENALKQAVANKVDDDLLLDLRVQYFDCQTGLV